jgi:hypothetical protein
MTRAEISNNTRFALRVLFDDKCRPILRPRYPDFAFRKPALNDVAGLRPWERQMACVVEKIDKKRP